MATWHSFPTTALWGGSHQNPWRSCCLHRAWLLRLTADTEGAHKASMALRRPCSPTGATAEAHLWHPLHPGVAGPWLWGTCGDPQMAAACPWGLSNSDDLAMGHLCGPSNGGARAARHCGAPRPLGRRRVRRVPSPPHPCSIPGGGPSTNSWSRSRTD